MRPSDLGSRIAAISVAVVGFLTAKRLIFIEAWGMELGARHSLHVTSKANGSARGVRRS